MPAPKLALVAFLEKVDEHGPIPEHAPELGPCCVWTAYCRPNGYGQFMRSGVPHHAHRWSYETFVGPIPDGLDLDHLCRVRACVRPSHLEPVTRAENLRRAPRMGPAPTLVCPRGHAKKLVPSGKWRCGRCERDADRRRRQEAA